MIRRLLALAALAGLLVGGVLHLLGEVGVADAVWAASTAMMLVPLTWSVARTLWRRDVGVDAIALVAMASALATGEYLAGAVVAVMLAGGNALEEYAAGRARRELTKLLERASRWVRGPLRRVSAFLGLSGGYQRAGLRISPFVSLRLHKPRSRRLTNNHERAGRVVGTLLTHRAKEETGEAAVSARPDHQQACLLGRINESVGRLSLLRDRLRVDALVAGPLGGPARDSVGPVSGRLVEWSCHDRNESRRSVNQRRNVPRRDNPQGRTSEFCFIYRPI